MSVNSVGSLKHNVAIVIPYFGKWPAWFEFFLQSCRYNTSVTWLFYTDCKIPDIKEEYIRFFHFTLEDFNRLASLRTGVAINIRHPYKLCDLKPAYGDIFAEHLIDFDFWGYGDIDLIYGNFDQFFSDEILDRYDVFSNHDEFISGHLCIIRNSPDAVSLYRKGGAYKKVFKDPFYTGFDEQLLKRKFNPQSTGLQPRMRSHLKRHMNKVAAHSIISRMVPAPIKSILRKRRSTEIKDFTSIVQHCADPEGIRVLQRKTFQSDLMLKKLGEKKWEIYWDKGRLISSFKQEEILYYHFILSKLSESFSFEGFNADMDQFTITNSGIRGGSV